MIRASLFAVIAGTALVSAAPPVHGPSAAVSADGYPPCSATVTDRCVQTYERGVGTVAAAPIRTAQGGPYESASTAIMSPDDYPVCSRSVTDRCVQHGGGSRLKSVRPVARARYIQAGERG